METLIFINDTMYLWISEICAAFWLVTSLALLRTWYKSRTPDALVVFLYLTALLIVANISGAWEVLAVLTVIHLFGYTILVWINAAHGYLRTRYGDYFLLMAGLFGLSDAVFLSLSLPIQYHAWVLSILYLSMAISTLYVCSKSPHNGGNLGKPDDMDYKIHKVFAQSFKG